MKVISIRQSPEYVDIAIAYFQKAWPSVLPQMYVDAISYSLDAKNSLPQWYLLEKEGNIIGCAGLITNDFISRGDLYPWLCALYIEEEQRGHEYATILMERIQKDTKSFGFEKLYLCTEHIDYYEKYGYSYIGNGLHPWGESSRIYEIVV